MSSIRLIYINELKHLHSSNIQILESACVCLPIAVKMKFWFDISCSRTYLQLIDHNHVKSVWDAQASACCIELADPFSDFVSTQVVR